MNQSLQRFSGNCFQTAPVHNTVIFNLFSQNPGFSSRLFILYANKILRQLVFGKKIDIIIKPDAVGAGPNINIGVCSSIAGYSKVKKRLNTYTRNFLEKRTWKGMFLTLRQDFVKLPTRNGLCFLTVLNRKCLASDTAIRQQRIS
jgi:hypothetical protein